MTTGRLAPAVKGLAVVSLFNDVASEMVYPLLPALVTLGLGGGPLALGALDGASDLVAAGLRWWSGALADRRRVRGRLIGAGYCLAVAVRPLMAIAQQTWQVVGIRMVDRVGKGLRSPARDAMIADLTEPSMLGRAFGLHRSADHLGAVLGSLLAFELLRRGWAVREVLGASVVPGVIALAALGGSLVLAKRGGRRDPVASEAPPPLEEATALAGGRIAWLAAVAAFRLPETLLLYRLQQLGAPVAAIPLLWGMMHVVRSAVSYPAGLLADRLGVAPALLVGGGLHAVVLTAMGWLASPTVAVVMFLLHGVVAGLAEPAERAAVARVAGHRLGTAYGRFQAMAGAGALVGGLGFGWLYGRLGASASFGAAAVVSLTVLLGWFAAERRAAA